MKYKIKILLILIHVIEDNFHCCGLALVALKMSDKEIKNDHRIGLRR